MGPPERSHAGTGWPAGSNPGPICYEEEMLSAPLLPTRENYPLKNTSES